MPMIDLFAPQGALSADGLTALAGRIVAAVNEAEGYAGSRFAASVSWTWVHEMAPGRLLVGGEPCLSPRWRVEIATPTGSLDAAAKARLAQEIAGLALEAEGATQDAMEASRIWCLFRDVAEGDWFAGARAASADGVRKMVARERAAA